MKKEKQYLKQSLDFEILMEAIGFFSINQYIENSYSNDDFLHIFTIETNQLKFSRLDDETNDFIEQFIPMPKTIMEGLEAIKLMFPDGWNKDWQEEILQDYISIIEKAQTEKLIRLLFQ